MHRASLKPSAAPVLPTLLAAALSASAALTATPAAAQSWPAKPIRLIVTLAPGSAVDIVARLTGEPISRALGQPVVVESRVGGGGVVAAEFVMRARRPMAIRCWSVRSPRMASTRRWCRRSRTTR